MEQAILDFIFGHDGVQQGFLGAAMAIGSGVSSLFGALTAGKQRRQARRQERRLNKELRRLEANRQEIIDPSAGMLDLSNLIKNPYENLPVATQAAEFQASQQDMSLAQTLDSMRAGGYSAGGATALANAAAMSKAQIAATIEQQEAQNARMAAQGRSEMQRMQIAEKQRIQTAQAAGKEFMFGAREQREVDKLNRTAGLMERQQAIGANATTALNQSLGGLFGSAFAAAGQLGAFSGGGKTGGNPNTVI